MCDQDRRVASAQQADPYLGAQPVTQHRDPGSDRARQLLPGPPVDDRRVVAGGQQPAPEGDRFLTRSRLFTQDETEALEAAGPPARGPLVP